MRLSVQYLNDAQGNVHAVQVPVADWKRLLKSLRTLQQRLKMKSDLSDALSEVASKGNNKKKSETLDQFLSAL